MCDRAIQQLSSEWKNAGVERGDMLLIHSSMRRTMRRLVKMGVEPDVKLVIRSFLDAIGETGTLLFPTFNFDFPNGVTFDINHTVSQMGLFTEAGRLWPGAIRTGHPIYSFAVIGADAGLFANVTNYSGYGKDSPFGIMHRNNAKIGVIDLPDQDSMTFYHYVEESLNVPYRYHKQFTGQYKDADGLETTRSFGLFVRDIENGVLTHVNPMGEILWQKGLYTGCRPQTGCGLRLISSTAFFDAVAQVINQGRAKGLLYENGN